MSDFTHRGGAPAQAVLFCPCGRSSILAKSLCAYCYHARYRDRLHFGGQRERALVRDGLSCTNCGAQRQIVMHHRRPGVNAPRLLSTLCRGCHAKVHKFHRAHFGMSPFLHSLWVEQHRDQAEQLNLPFPVDDAGSGVNLEVQESLWAMASLLFDSEQSALLTAPILR